MTNRTDAAQLCVYVRFFDGKCFREELLGLLLLGHRTDEVVFEKISTSFKDNGLDMERVSMLVTDGAPSMAGKISGLAARWVAVAPQITSLHCIVHQAVLCAKLCLYALFDMLCHVTEFKRETMNKKKAYFSCDGLLPVMPVGCLCLCCCPVFLCLCASVCRSLVVGALSPVWAWPVPRCRLQECVGPPSSLSLFVTPFQRRSWAQLRLSSSWFLCVLLGCLCFVKIFFW